MPDLNIETRPGNAHRTRLFLAFLLALLMGVTTLPGAVQGADSVSDRLSAARGRQASLRGAMARQDRLIADLDGDAARVRSALQNTNAQLDGIGDDLRALRRDIAAATAAIRRQEGRGRQLREEIRQLDTTLSLLDLEISQGAEDLDARRQAFGRRLADSQRTAQTSLLEQVLNASSFADILSNASAYEAYAAQDAEEARVIEQDQVALDTMRAMQATTRHRTDQLRRAAEKAAQELRERRVELNAAKAKARRLERNVKALKRRQLARARSIASNRRQAAAIARQHERAQHQLERRIRGLVRQAQRQAEARRRAAERRQRSRGGSSTATYGRFSWPAAGMVTQEYGCTGFYLEPRRGSCKHFHDGIDIANGLGTPVRASDFGVVAFVGWNPYDNDPAYQVIVAHGGGYTTGYFHLQSRRVVRAGQTVRKGQVIGYMGSTGNSTGPHLHWEVYRNGRSMNPRTAG
ncbi:MAG: peptidoglycan DD-metalloendopeptidase family protein [Candidatus Limnocylindrales bacterium]